MKGSVLRYEGTRDVSWRIKYRDASGKQVMEVLGTEAQGWDRKKAEVELARRRVAVADGWVRPEPMTFEAFALAWLEDEEVPRRWRPKTVNAYRHAVERLVLFFGRKRLADVRPRHVAAYIAAASKGEVGQLGPASINRDVSILFDVFKSAKRQELVTANPAADAARPKLPPFRPRILTPLEVGLIRRAFTDAQARVAFLVLVLCGLRQSELLNLRWRDVDLVDGVLRVVESKSEDGRRSVAVPPVLKDELVQHLALSSYQGADEYVFCHPTRGSRYRATTFDTHFKAAREAAGLGEMKIRPFHDLRHTYVTNAAAAGMNAVALMTSAGHSDMKTTKRYLHLAGTVFADDAASLERRMLGGSSTEPSTGLLSSGVPVGHEEPRNDAVSPA